MADPTSPEYTESEQQAWEQLVDYLSVITAKIGTPVIHLELERAFCQALVVGLQDDMDAIGRVVDLFIERREKIKAEERESITFYVSDPGDYSVGLFEFSDEVTVSFKDGSVPLDEYRDEFISDMVQLLKDHYDTSGVSTNREDLHPDYGDNE